MSILEPNFKTFTPICKIEVSNSFSWNVVFMLYMTSFDVGAGKNLHATLDFINFLFKRSILIPQNFEPRKSTKTQNKRLSPS